MNYGLNFDFQNFNISKLNTKQFAFYIFKFLYFNVFWKYLFFRNLEHPYASSLDDGEVFTINIYFSIIQSITIL